jgi:hypothetical protein
MADPEVIRGGWVSNFPGGRLQQLGQHTQRVKARLRERVRYSRPLRMVEQVVEHLCGAGIRVVDHLSAAGPTG